jgi:uncharacterized membrane protein YhaH (DUF805 family)
MSNYRKLPPSSMKEGIKDGWKNFYVGTGRTRRSDFFWWFGTYFLIVLFPVIYCTNLWSTGCFIVMCGPAFQRRVHDTGHKNAILHIFFCCLLLYFTLVEKVLFFDKSLGCYLDSVIKGSSYYIILSTKIAIAALLCWLVVICMLDSQKDENKYGISPKYVKEEE